MNSGGGGRGEKRMRREEADKGGSWPPMVKIDHRTRKFCFVFISNL